MNSNIDIIGFEFDKAKDILIHNGFTNIQKVILEPPFNKKEYSASIERVVKADFEENLVKVFVCNSRILMT